jgi:D-cysteine desulfhydrase family pyridoxal phosphate-dependent enzyme
MMHDYEKSLSNACLPDCAQDGANCEALASFPRVPIVHAPTPLEFLERLSARLGGPSIWVKRDDSTGLAGGGNKVRKLEFLVGAALQEQANTIITTGALQSNHARQTVAAANRFNMRSILLLTDSVNGRGPEYRSNGNFLINRILGAEVHIVPSDIEIGGQIAIVATREMETGNRPYVIPVGGSSAIGTLGYVACFLELAAQLQQRNVGCDAIILPTGSGGSQAGIVLGTLLSGSSVPVFGVSVGASMERQRAKMEELLQSAGALLNLGGEAIEHASLLIDDRFVGPGYGSPSQETIDAIRVVAESEGLLLDPVYTGKAMACLIASIRDGRFGRGQNVVFIHTGGAQVLGAYPEHFMWGASNHDWRD